MRAYIITKTLSPGSVSTYSSIWLSGHKAGSQVMNFLPSSCTDQASAVILQSEQAGSHPLIIVFQILCSSFII